MNSAVNQRKNRAIEGHPARLAMLKYNRSDKHKASHKKWLSKVKDDPERYEKHLQLRRKGSAAYDYKVNQREVSQITAINSRKKWTFKEEQKLEALYLSGVSAREIGVILGRSLQGVERKLQALRIMRRKQDAGTRQQAA